MKRGEERALSGSVPDQMGGSRGGSLACDFSPAFQHRAGDRTGESGRYPRTGSDIVSNLQSPHHLPWFGLSSCR